MRAICPGDAESSPDLGWRGFNRGSIELVGSLARDTRPYGRKCAGIRLRKIRRTVRSSGCCLAEGVVIDYRSLTPRHFRSQPSSDAAYLPRPGLFILEPPHWTARPPISFDSTYSTRSVAVVHYPPASGEWLLLLATITECDGSPRQTIGRMTYSADYAIPTQYDVARSYELGFRPRLKTSPGTWVLSPETQSRPDTTTK